MPAGWVAKTARKYREALVKLDEALDTDDEIAVGRAQKKLDALAPGLGASDEIERYRQEYERYRVAKDTWRNDTCGACGAPLLNPFVAPGCARCMSEAEIALLDLLGDAR